MVDYAKRTPDTTVETTTVNGTEDEHKVSLIHQKGEQKLGMHWVLLNSTQLTN